MALGYLALPLRTHSRQPTQSFAPYSILHGSTTTRRTHAPRVSAQFGRDCGADFRENAGPTARYCMYHTSLFLARYPQPSQTSGRFSTFHYCRAALKDRERDREGRPFGSSGRLKSFRTCFTQCLHCSHLTQTTNPNLLHKFAVFKAGGSVVCH